MMDEPSLSSVVDLEEKLTSAKQSLVILNENIRRFVGRGPRTEKSSSNKEAGVNGRRPDFSNDKPAHRQDFNFNKSKIRSMDGNSKSRSPYSINRPSAGDNDEYRPRINSRVIREMPSREEVVEAQGTDSQSRARNRRMFGSLLGTLQKFCQEESRLKQKADKKAEIERKLEEQELQERALLKKERETLFLDRKRKQFEIRRLEIKMARLKDFQVWESAMIHQKHQIRTKTAPHLFFSPRSHTSRTEKLLGQSKAEIEQLIERKRKDLQAELRDLENSQLMDEEFQGEEGFAEDTHDSRMETETPANCEKESKENGRKSSKDKLLSHSKIGQES